jgi:hypothetical protein
MGRSTGMMLMLMLMLTLMLLILDVVVLGRCSHAVTLRSAGT